MESGKVDISQRTVFFVTGFVALIWALYLIREVIILLFIALIFMSALSPIVERMEKYKIPRVLGIAMVYVVVIVALALLLSLIITPLVEQTNNLTQNLPRQLAKVLPTQIVDGGVFQQEIASFTRNAFSITLTIFNQVVALISIAVLTFYLLLERDKLDQLLSQLFIGRQEQAKRIVRRVEDKLGAWLRGQLVLSLVIGLMAFIALTLLSVPYAVPLAILAGLLEVVPVIGPIISSIPAIAVAFLISPLTGFLTAAAFFLIQQLENHLIVPQLMRKAVGLNPLIVILSVAVGGKLLGIVGALLAVPIAVVIQIFLEEMVRERSG